MKKKGLAGENRLFLYILIFFIKHSLLYYVNYLISLI